MWVRQENIFILSIHQLQIFPDDFPLKLQVSLLLLRLLLCSLYTSSEVPHQKVGWWLFLRSRQVRRLGRWEALIRGGKYLAAAIDPTVSVPRGTQCGSRAAVQRCRCPGQPEPHLSSEAARWRRPPASCSSPGMTRWSQTLQHNGTRVTAAPDNTVHRPVVSRRHDALSTHT